MIEDDAYATAAGAEVSWPTNVDEICVVVDSGSECPGLAANAFVDGTNELPVDIGRTTAEYVRVDRADDDFQ